MGLERLDMFNLQIGQKLTVIESEDDRYIVSDGDGRSYILHHKAPDPFNPDFRPGFQQAKETAYELYCDGPLSPKGHKKEDYEIRAEHHQRICEALRKIYPTIKEIHEGQTDAKTKD